jgi:hypothetical protein
VRPNSWYRSAIEEGQAAGVSALVFIAFVLAGCLYIILAKLSGIEQLYVTFVPIAAMLGYALLITLARRLRLRDDQSGDNLYYMGFLFTLTSLGVSLYQFSSTRGAEEIVQNFGIAIGSTIAGIGLRVIFNQMRRDPIEVERMMRLELAEAARRVRRELDSSVADFGYFRRSAQQSAADSFSHMTETYDQMLAKFFARLDEVAKKVTIPVEAASRRSGAAIDELSKTVGATLTASARQFAGETKKLSSRVGEISSALDEVTTKLKAMHPPEVVVEARLEPFARMIAEAVEQMRIQCDQQARAVKDALTVANASNNRSTDMVAALRSEFDSAAATNRAALDAAITMIRAAADVVSDMKASSKEYADALGVMLEKTEEAMRTITDVVVQWSAESSTRTDRLTEQLPEIEAKVQALTKAADRISLLVGNYR